MRAWPRPALPAALAVLLLLLLPGCGGARSQPPGVGGGYGGIPDLAGARVMVLPVQSRAGGVPGDPDAELAFALSERQGRVQWILPAELRRIAAASPGMGPPLQGLAVGVFLQAEVRRVGDPLYGDLRRLAGMAGAAAALVPVEVRSHPAEEPGESTVGFASALIDTRSGRVYWFGIVEGEAGPSGSPAVLASAAAALARSVSR